MTDYVSEGKVVTYSNGTGSDISAGDEVVVGDSVGVALVDIADGEDGSVSLSGRYKNAPKATGTAWSQGDELDYDSSTGEFTKGLSAASGDVSGCAIAAEDAVAGASTAEIILTNPGTAS